MPPAKAPIASVPGGPDRDRPDTLTVYSPVRPSSAQRVVRVVLADSGGAACGINCVDFRSPLPLFSLDSFTSLRRVDIPNGVEPWTESKTVV